MEKTADVVETKPKITCGFVVTYLKNAVVEPYLMLFMFTFAGRGIINQSLFKDKACLVQLGLNRSICDNLHNYSDYENDVQRVANNFHMGALMIGLVPSIFTSIFLSSWSDSYGRKIPLVIASVGIILENLGLIWNLVDFDLPMVYLLLPSIPAGLFGGVMVIMTCCMSYLADDSDANTRVLRFAMLEVVFIFAGPIVTAICGAIYEHSGYLPVFLTSLTATILGTLFLVVRLKEKRKKKLSKFKESMSSLFSFDNVKANVKTCLKDRGGTTRKEMWLIFFAMCCSILNKMGTHSIEFFFVSKMYNWSNYKLSIVSMICHISKGIAILVSVPLLTTKFNVSDITLSLIGEVSSMALSFQKAFAFKEWMYYFANVTGLLSGLATIGIKARLSKLVPKEEIGRVFSVMILCESITPVIAMTVFTQLYNFSVGFFPGLTFLVASMLLFGTMGVFIWISLRADSAPFENQTESIENHVDMKTQSDSLSSSPEKTNA